MKFVSGFCCFGPVFGLLKAPFLSLHAISEGAFAVLEGEFIPKDIVARNSINGGLAEPALADHFAGNRGLMRRRCAGESFTQVKIAADTFRVMAIQAEDGLGIVRIDSVFHLAVSRGARRAEIGKFNGQRFQVVKLLGKT